MGIVTGLAVLLVCSYLLGAALQKPRLIRPYLLLFALCAGLAVAAIGMGTQVGGIGEWIMLCAKLLALLGCLALCVHLAIVVVLRLLDRRSN